MKKSVLFAAGLAVLSSGATLAVAQDATTTNTPSTTGATGDHSANPGAGTPTDVQHKGSAASSSANHSSDTMTDSNAPSNIRTGSDETSGNQSNQNAATGDTMNSNDNNHQAMAGHHHKHSAHNDKMMGSGDRETTALNLLSAQGYTDIQNITQSGHMYQATVMKDGHTMSVNVDPQSGQIQPQG